MDLDARIGDGVQLVNAEGIQEADGADYAIRDGVTVVPRGAQLAAGTVV